jgi:5-methylcytosine-specific restriction protein A
MSGLYDYAWQKRRERHLRKHPLCVRCRQAGRATLATVCDHIESHHGDPVKFRGPIQSLCKPCHDAKTLSEDRGMELKPKRRVGVDGIPEGWADE